MPRSLVEIIQERERQNLEKYNNYGDTRLELKPLKNKNVRVIANCKIKQVNPKKNHIKIVLLNAVINDSINIDHLIIQIPIDKGNLPIAFQIAQNHEKRICFKGKVQPYKRQYGVTSYGISDVKELISIENIDLNNIYRPANYFFNRKKLEALHDVSTILDPYPQLSIKTNRHSINKSDFVQKNINTNTQSTFLTDVFAMKIEQRIAQGTNHSLKTFVQLFTKENINHFTTDQINKDIPQRLAFWHFNKNNRVVFINNDNKRPKYYLSINDRAKATIDYLNTFKELKPKTIRKKGYLDAKLFYEEGDKLLLVYGAKHAQAKNVLKTMQMNCPEYKKYIWVNPLNNHYYTYTIKTEEN